VRTANIESKSHLRAAVSELVEARPGVHYFHSYEMVVTSERMSDLADVAIPELDLDWLRPPAKTGRKGRKWPAPLRWAAPLAKKILGSTRKF
jgi:hypothetical protein